MAASENLRDGLCLTAQRLIKVIHANYAAVFTVLSKLFLKISLRRVIHHQLPKSSLLNLRLKFVLKIILLYLHHLGVLNVRYLSKTCLSLNLVDVAELLLLPGT